MRLQLFCLLMLILVGERSLAVDSYKDRSIDVSLGAGKKMSVGYSLHSETFDPAKPTIVYLAGGPMPFSFRQRRPEGLPKDAQVIVIDYIGTTRERKNVPELSQQEILRAFNSDRQAEVIRSVVKQERLQTYVIWGQSHGVQIGARAVDLIQRDPTMSVKPIAAVFDSGIGRAITLDDERHKQSLGKRGFQGRCLATPAEEAAEAAERKAHPPPEISATAFEKYIAMCGYDFSKKPRARDGMLEAMKKVFEESRRDVGSTVSADQLRVVFGCAPHDRIDYNTWQTAFTCGEFTTEFNVRMCLEHAPPQYQASCKNQPPCYENKLDAANLRFGKTAILGIQSLDDCNNWTKSMDALMASLHEDPKQGVRAKSEYVQVADAGGHVTFARKASWDSCRSSGALENFSATLFKGDVVSAAQTLRSCYRSPKGKALDKSSLTNSSK